MKRSIKLTMTGISILACSLTSISFATQQRRIALVIGNGSYKSAPLANPVNDANDMAASLRDLGFEVIHKINATQREMEGAIRKFGKRLKKGGVGLFCFAGHGMQVNGRNYLMPIKAEVYYETDVKYEAVDAGRALDAMYNAGNAFNIVILDACRDNPFTRSFRSKAGGLARIDAPRGTIIAYSTTPDKVAIDGTGRNSPYTSALLKYMRFPELTIEQVFKKVRGQIDTITDGKQIPWESTSLTGDFYFTPGRAIRVARRPQQKQSTPTSGTALREERERLERERQELERLKLEIERKRLEAEHERLEAEKEKLETAKLTSTLTLKEIASDGRFKAYDNGTVKDTKTGLMWAKKDNGCSVTWQEAKEYCENYRGGGYTDWRMPTRDELKRLYDRNKSYQATPQPYNVHLTELIQLTACCVWASDASKTRGSWIPNFSDYHVNYGRDFYAGSDSRALPVRSGN